MFQKLVAMMIAVCVVVGFSAGVSSAGETDLLVQKLVEKGVLSAGEAQELLTQTKEEIKKQNSMGTNELIPTWVQNTKIKGDVRVRFEDIKDKAAKDLTHERLRVRLGLESKINDQMKIGIGMATGKPSDPRSRNISLGNSTDSYNGTDNYAASAKNIQLDYAYADYTPFQYATITAGKFQNPIWSPWDMIWKGDITPEGAALKLNYPVASNLQLFMNNMAFILRNPDSAIKGVQNESLYAFQPGVSWDVTSNINLKSALTYYRFLNLKDQPRIAYSTAVANATNSTYSGCNQGAAASTACYTYNYDSLSPSAEIGFKNPFGESIGSVIPYASIFGDYIYNISHSHPTDGRGGFDAGVKLGYQQVSDKAQWQLKLATSKLGRDSWVDAFSDSDRYKKGSTNTQSYESILEYGLGKNTSLVVDYYYSFLLNKSASAGRAPENLLQIDWNLKF
ncbi:MAG: putative porin [Candidatus Omnitrophica bacterium]|nr:putative porin [Candidatus Omnitrophota bacterium]